MKAAGYLIAKWELVNSTNGYVQGAGYTDVHARMPALTILFFLSLAAAVILLANVRSRGWSLPAVAVGLWLFVALVIGVLYPTILQALKVTPGPEHPRAALHPAQHRRDARRPSTSTRSTITASPGRPSITSAQIKADAPTLANIRLWDPATQHRPRDGDAAPVDPLVLHVHRRWRWTATSSTAS